MRPTTPPPRPAPSAGRPGIGGPHLFLRRLRRRTTIAALAGFAALLGLTATNVVGVTARGSTADQPHAAASSVPASLPPGDFFGGPAASGGGIAGAPGPVAAPPLIDGGGT